MPTEMYVHHGGEYWIGSEDYEAESRQVYLQCSYGGLLIKFRTNLPPWLRCLYYQIIV